MCLKTSDFNKDLNEVITNLGTQQRTQPVQRAGASRATAGFRRSIINDPLFVQGHGWLNKFKTILALRYEMDKRMNSGNESSQPVAVQESESRNLTNIDKLEPIQQTPNPTMKFKKALELRYEGTYHQPNNRQ